MTFKVRKFMKKFNGSAVYHKPTRSLAHKDLEKTCSGSKLAEGETAEELIHNARAEQRHP